MSVKYSWNRQNGAAMPSVRFMSIEPAEDYYKGMPLKLKEKGIVEPTDGDPEYICMAEYNPDAEIQPLEIPVQEVFPDVVYDRMNDDGTTEEVRFGSKGGGGSDLLETVEAEVPLVITWDGNTEGKEVAQIPGANGILVKMSDAKLTIDQLLGSTAVFELNGEETILVATEENTMDAGVLQGIPVLMMGEFILCPYGDTSDFGVSLSPGVWFAYDEGFMFVKSLTCPNATTTTTKQQIKTKFLPDALQFGDKRTSAPLNITWDGDISGKETIPFGDGQCFVKISDAILTNNELIGATITQKYITSEETITNEVVLTAEDIVDGSLMGGLPLFMVQKEVDSFIIIVMCASNDFSMEGLTFSAGVWTQFGESDSMKLWVSSISNPNVMVATGEIEKLDNKFLDLAWLPTTSKQNVEILPETTLDFANGRLFDISSNLTEQLTAGNKYTVFWNGEKFELNATRVEVFEGEYITYIGNINLLMSGDAEGGYDFVIYLIEAGSMSTWVGVRDGVTTAVAQIMGNVTRYNTIPNDFLPPELSAKPIIFNNHTHQYIQEIANALNAGREVYINDGRLYHVVSAMYDPIDSWDTVLMISIYGIYYIDGWEDGYLDGNNGAGTIRPMLQRDSSGITSLFMRSSNHKRFKVNVDDSGQLVTTEV